MVQEGVDDMTLLSKVLKFSIYEHLFLFDLRNAKQLLIQITNEQISANLEQRYYKNIIYVSTRCSEQIEAGN